MRFFRAVCFTETPLSEIHCLLDIDRRQVDMEPYGIVFLKDRLLTRGVSPVLYLNNSDGTMDSVAKALFRLIQNEPEAAARLLQLFSVFGQKLTPPGYQQPPKGDVDFR